MGVITGCAVLVLLAALFQSSRCLQPGFIRYHDVANSKGYTVTYDERSFLINGVRTIFLSGSVHYPRSTPGMWDRIFAEMVADGLNAVEVYVFWNVHQFKENQEYDFTGPANLPLFLQRAAAAGLFVNLRIGPYVCAEWNFGGVPVWINNDPKYVVRSDNKYWEDAMAKFVTDILKTVDSFLARNGGPIVLAQIENEFGWEEYIDYIDWCGELVKSLDVGIPWVMCNGLSANNTVNTCNGNDCQGYAMSHSARYPGQPLAWTEDEGWFEVWKQNGDQLEAPWDDRSPEDMANVILAWFARGGAHHNYYMWYGGNHMARWAGSGIANRYADGVNFHSDLLPNEPKKTHLQRLHILLAQHADILMSCDAQWNNPVHLLWYDNATKKFENGTQQLAFVYTTKDDQIVFVQNAATIPIITKYNNITFSMQPTSVLVLDKDNKILFDSSQVNSTGLPTQRVYVEGKIEMGPFSAWQETIKEAMEGGTVSELPMEQLQVTQDETDYLFYHAMINPLPTSSNYTLIVGTRKANGLLVYLNDKYQGAWDNHAHAAGNMTAEIHIGAPQAEAFNLTILSVSLGLYNGMPPGFREFKGIVNGVQIPRAINITKHWLHRPKLTGELKEVYTSSGSSSVPWDSDAAKYNGTTLTWFKTMFTVPEYDTDRFSLLLDAQGLGRGHYYVNGVDLGRYWTNGQDVQRYYFIPPDLIEIGKPQLLVIGEVLGASDPTKAQVVFSTVVVP